eukprot:gene19736-23944_t
MFSQMMLGAMTQPVDGSGGGQGNMAIRPEQWLAMGVGMGTALLQSSGPMVNSFVGQQIHQNAPYASLEEEGEAHQSAQLGAQVFDQHSADFPQVSEEQSLAYSVHSGQQQFEQLGQQKPSRVSSSNYDVVPGRSGEEPIGKPYPTQILSSDKTLDHSEDEHLRQAALRRFEQPLTTMEKARRLQILGDRE